MSSKKEIAIIGMAGRFPGADNYNEYWELLKNGINAVQEITPDRWDINKYYSADFDEAGKSISKWGGLLTDIHSFDHRFFKISPMEAAAMDIQQKLLLQEAARCIDDSGVPMELLQRKKTAVFIGVMASDSYANTVEKGKLNSYSSLGSYHSILSNRISNFFGFTGESITLDTACSSSLVAIHQAKKSLLAGECDYALVGAASIIAHPFRYISFSKARMLSPDGQCKTFDQTANGYVPGEGVGLILLQKYQSAVKNGTTIHAVISGTAVNHTGKGLSITAPRISSQQEAIVDAIKNAGIGSERISYIEAHGTGTSLGDPIEVEALKRAFNETAASEEKSGCRIGSVKSNIGHLEAAAGVAGLMKVVLMLKNREIVKTLHVNSLNPVINFSESPFEVALKNMPWSSGTEVNKYAGISSFGFGGVNSHIIVRDHVPEKVDNVNESEDETEYPFLFSAHTLDTLKKIIVQWKSLLPIISVSIKRLSANTVFGKVHHAYRFNFVASTKTELLHKLEKMQQEIEAIQPVKKTDINWIVPEIQEKEWSSYLKEVRKDQLLLTKLQKIFKKYGLDILQLNDQSIAELSETKKTILHVSLLYIIIEKRITEIKDLRLLADSEIGYFVICMLCNGIQLDPALKSIVDKTTAELVIPVSSRKFIMFDPAEERWLYPIDPSEKFYKELKNTIVKREEFAQLIKTGRELWKHQFTFKKFIAEWFAPLSNELQVNLEEILDKNVSPPFLQSHLNCIAVALVNAIKRLQKKWDLQDKETLSNPFIECLAELIIDKIATPLQAIELLINGIQDISEFNYATVDAEKYNFLKQYQRSVTLPCFHSKSIVLKTELMDFLKQKSILISAGSVASEKMNTASEMNITRYRCTDELANLWSQGVEIDWTACFDFTYHPLSLPVFYPFEKKSETKTLPSIPSEIPAVKQLLSKPTTFYKTFDSLTDLIIRDHRICSYLIVPAATMIELVVACIATSEGTAVQIEKIQFLKPVFVERKTAVLVEINQDAFRMRHEDELVACGKFSKIISQVSQEQSLFNLDAKEHIVPAKVYDFLKQKGYTYGETLQVINKIEEGSEFISYQLINKNNSAKRIIAAELLDGLFHCVLWAAHQFKNAFDGTDDLFVPFGIHQITLHKPLPASCNVVIRKQQIILSASQITTDISVYSDGWLCLELKGIVLQKVKTNFLNTFIDTVNKSQATSVLYCKPVWTRSDISDSKVTSLHILLYEKEADKSTIEKTAFSPGRHSFSLKEVIKDSNSLLKLITTYEGSHILIQIQLHASGETGIQAMQRLYQQIELAFHLVKHKLNQKGNSRLVIQFTSSGNLCVDSISADFATGALAGFSKTLLLESPKVKIQLLDSDSSSLQDRIEEGVREAFAVDWQSELCYRKGKRLIRNYQKVEQKFSNRFVAMDTDCIMVVGGTGGIGWEVCNYLCSSSNAHIVVVGRKQEHEVEEKLGLLRPDRQTANLSYYSCDTADEEAMKALFRLLDEKKYQLTGIIHSGGILEDRLLLNKSWESFMKVMNAKATSAMLLHQLSLKHPLRLFAVFSSAVTLTGNIGQADYATANMFLNQLIQYRNLHFETCKNYVINWTLWSETGMGNSASAGNALTKIGLAPIDRKQGIAAFASILAKDESDVTVLNTESTIKELLYKPKPPSLQFNIKQENQPSMNISETLKKIIAEAIGLEEQIEENVDFREYGVDSVAINTIVEKLTAIYGQHVYPSLIMEYPTLQELSAYFSELTEQPALKASLENIVQEQPKNHHEKINESTIPVSKKNAGADEDAKEKIPQLIRSIIAGVIDMQAVQIEDDVDFREYGIDSVAINTIISKLSLHFKDGIYPSILIENPTVNELAAYLLKEETFIQATASSPIPQIKNSTIHIRESSKTEQKNETADCYKEQIAIIGFAGKFPQSPTVETFWKNLVEGQDLISVVPKMRWDIEKRYDPSGAQHKSYVKKGGFIQGVDFFDPSYFGIAEDEAKNIDPQQRLFLELTQELLDRAGYKKEELKDSLTGVFIGANESNYARKFNWRNKFYGKHGVVNVVANLIAGRIADFYDFTGPAEVCYTACSSSLVALHNACLALKNGDCEQAIAGGIELLLDEEWFVGFSNSKALAPDGKSKVFDEKANGFVLSEGLGAVLLKPLKKAIEAGDQIFAVISSSSINNDGSTMGLTTPNLKAQKQLLKKALINGNINPETITYFEAHGTGTPLGDPTEIKAATEVFREYSSKTQWCALGSVKSNIGHTLSAAGMAGIIKILLSFNNKIIPATINCPTPHSKFNFNKSPFYPVTALKKWDTDGINRRAAVSSFGFGGTNVHFILDEFDLSKQEYTPSRKMLPLTVFNKKSYWITEDDSHELSNMKNILERLSAKNISIEEAREELVQLQLI